MIKNRRSFIIGLKSIVLQQNKKKFLNKYKPWGVILFSRNIKTIGQTKKLTDEIRKIFKDNNIDTIYHLAAILSTRAELNPIMAHNINVGGFLNIIENINKSNVKLFFPSSIAVYLLEKKNNTPINEEEYCNPNNIYGCNKLYCEKLGTYFSQYSNKINE